MILASKSPRRKEILDNFFNSVIIETKEIEEISDKIGVHEQIKDIAYKKCIEIANVNKGAYVVAADTVVVFNNEILGKPRNRDDAVKMLKMLSGQKHQVITAYCLINSDKKIFINDYVISDVEFNELTMEEIAWYVSTGDPMDKAGSYGIQGHGNVLVKRIEGDFYNIMGFPLSKFIEDIKAYGYKLAEIQQF